MVLVSSTFNEKIKSIFTTHNRYFNSILSYLLIGLIALFVLNGFFLFKGTFTPISKYDYELQSNLFLKLENSFIGNLPLPISSYYMSSLDTGMGETDDTAYLFFLGEYFIEKAPKTFYLVSFLVKSTLPVIILFIIIHLLYLLFVLSKSTNEKIGKTKFTYGYILFLFYFIFIFTTFITNIVAGLRHLGVLYPLIFVLISSIVSIRLPFSKITKSFVWVLIGWHLIAYLLAYPFFIPYFNELIGNNNGYLYFRDTNADYHELYYHVIDYKEIHPEVILFPGCFVEKGRVTMSPNDLNFQRASCYGWLKNFEPVDYIGNSWPVYDVDGQWSIGNNGQPQFSPSPNMKLREAKLNRFLKLFI